MGELAELGTQSREGYLRNPERLGQNLKDIGQKAEPLKRLATEGFGQIMFGDEGTITKMPRANAMGSISRGDPLAAEFYNHKLKHLMGALKDPNKDRSLILPHIKDYLRKQSESVIR